MSGLLTVFEGDTRPSGYVLFKNEKNEHVVKSIEHLADGRSPLYFSPRTR